MITKGTAEYREAQRTANLLVDYSLERVTVKNPSSINKYNDLEMTLSLVKDLGTFASQVAETLLNQMKKTWYMPTISSKQAWCIACAMVENEIYLD